MENHGLLSKGRRVLEIAGWSEEAQKDMEVYALVDTEGLTPFLTVLNEAVLAGQGVDEAAGDDAAGETPARG